MVYESRAIDVRGDMSVILLREYDPKASVADRLSRIADETYSDSNVRQYTITSEGLLREIAGGSSAEQIIDFLMRNNRQPVIPENVRSDIEDIENTKRLALGLEGPRIVLYTGNHSLAEGVRALAEEGYLTERNDISFYVGASALRTLLNRVLGADIGLNVGEFERKVYVLFERYSAQLPEEERGYLSSIHGANGIDLRGVLKKGKRYVNALHLLLLLSDQDSLKREDGVIARLRGEGVHSSVLLNLAKQLGLEVYRADRAYRKFGLHEKLMADIEGAVSVRCDGKGWIVGDGQLDQNVHGFEERISGLASSFLGYLPDDLRNIARKRYLASDFSGFLRSRVPRKSYLHRRLITILELLDSMDLRAGWRVILEGLRQQRESLRPDETLAILEGCGYDLRVKSSKGEEGDTLKIGGKTYIVLERK